MRNRSPYENVNWNRSRIVSISHGHCNKQSLFDTYVNAGVRHFSLSNYRPPVPLYPITDFFSNVPNDAISCPNAEHVNFRGDGGKVNLSHLHMNSIGSTYIGSTENEDPWYNPSWKSFILGALKNLIYTDGGGITINHTAWSEITVDGICQLLDFDERVLGMEIYNKSTDKPDTTWMVDDWDAVLSTGRQCFAFAVPDWRANDDPDWGGFIFLMPDEPTEHGCLRAYRNGEFYCGIKNDGLAFGNITLSGNTFSVSTTENATIKIVTAQGATQTTGTSASLSVSRGDKYVRAEAHTDGNDIYSNAIMLTEAPRTKKADQMIFVM